MSLKAEGCYKNCQVTDIHLRASNGHSTHKTQMYHTNCPMCREEMKDSTTEKERKTMNSILDEKLFRIQKSLLNETRKPTVGPGSHTLPSTICRKSGITFPKSSRSEAKPDITPGPGSYTLSPSLSDTVLKGSFNVLYQMPF